MTSPWPKSRSIKTTIMGFSREALQSVDPKKLLLNQVVLEGQVLKIQKQSFALNDFRALHVIGAGKGAVGLFRGLKKVLGSRISSGIVVSLPEFAFNDREVSFLPGAHPLPDERSLQAGRAVLDYARKQVKKNDLVVALITGGASALLVYPRPGLTLADKIELNRLLIRSGADIREINALRQQASALKGGKLAQLIHPARIITLAVSDVIDSPLSEIGSGPTLPSGVSFSQARCILEKYGLTAALPPRLKTFFSRKAPTDEKARPRDFLNDAAFLLGDNLTALQAVVRAALKAGVNAHILSCRDQGDAGAAAKSYATAIKKTMTSGQPFRPPVLLLSGGEMTVEVRGNGMGGRNQEFMMHLLLELQDVCQPYFALSLGTDGLDGNSPAAGAWIDQRTWAKVKKLGLDPETYLLHNDSYRFFKKLDQLIVTGPTGTNVMDLRFFFSGLPC